MLRLKDIPIITSRKELESLPEGKLLINTINAHSYNTAGKDPLFAEALMKGGCADTGRGKHRDGVPLAEGEMPATGTHRGMGPLHLRNGTAEPTGGHVFLHGEQREGARPDTGEGGQGVSEHTHRDVLAAL